LDTELFKLMLNPSGNIGAPPDTTDFLTDDPLKSAVGLSGFIEKFLDTPSRGIGISNNSCALLWLRTEASLRPDSMS
jgi:hypothetical protein